MARVFKNGLVYRDSRFVRGDIAFDRGVFIPAAPGSPSDTVVDCSSYVLLPGLADVHVHLREPGFSYKETIRSGTLAAAHGGYTTVCSMPNLNPVPDSLVNLIPQLKAIESDARVHVAPYGSVTVGENGEALSDMEAIAPYVVAFSDDGHGVQSGDLMRSAMLEAARLGKIIAAHCEDNSLLRGGWIHDGEYARAHGHRGICSESEWGQIKRDIRLVRETGCAYHVCHVSTAESVELIRRAKADGLNISCETAPHYLLLDESDLQDDGRFKMNPPLRSASDREALIQGIRDGTIDIIATDHAPHSDEEKSRGLEKSLMGIVGLETAFPLLYTGLVRPGVITLERLLELMQAAPCRRFGLGGGIKPGHPADFTVFDLNTRYIIDPGKFLSKGKSTPFSGREVYGRCVLTVCCGKTVWNDGTINLD